LTILQKISEVLKEVIEGAKEGVSVRELCVKADQRIEEETGKAFKKDKKLQKGRVLTPISRY